MGRDYYCKLIHAEELIWFLGCLNDEFHSCSFLNSHPSRLLFSSNHRDVLYHGAGRTSIISLTIDPSQSEIGDRAGLTHRTD